MKHYGGITDIDGAKVEPVDIICGGSPCQDLSVAGKQAGLDGGTRSHLFYEMVRIIKEMRKATDGKKPRYIVWENVPGAFSSNNGYDFMSVLQSFAEIAEADVHVPEPERKANKLVWRYAGEMVGFGWSIAWRTVDAQYWGVPQRRRRIYLVVDLDSERAGEVLFERESVRGYFAESGTERQGTSADAERSVGTDDRERKCYGIVSNGNGEAWPIEEKYIALSCSGQAGQGYPCDLIPCSFEPGIAAREGGHIYEGVCGTLRAQAGDNRMAVAYSFDSIAYNSMKSKNPHSGCRQVEAAKTLAANNDQYLFQPVPNFLLDDQGGQQINVRTDEISPTLRAETHGNLPCVICKQYLFENHSQDTRYKGPLDVSPMLPAQLGTSGNNTPFVVDANVPVYCLQGNGIDRADTAGCNGAGWKEDVSYTLNTIDRPAVAFAMQGFGDYKKSDVASGLKARDYKDATDLVCGVECRNMNESPELYPTLQAKTNGGQSLNFSHAVRVYYIVRRLMPLECSRLQGFPDCWELDLETPNPTEEDIAFWAEVFETHRKVVSPDIKPKTRNQIIKWLKDPYSDSASYKMWGNGMALPNMLFVVSRIKEVHQNA